MSFSTAQQSAAANTQGGSSDRRDDAQAQPSTPRTPGKAFRKNRSRRLDGDREDISKLHCILSDQFRPLPEVEENDDRVVRGPTADLFPLCATASYKFKGDPILRERLKDACAYGYQHLGPDRDVLHLPNPLTLSRSECITFKQELQLLDQVVGYVWKDGTTEEPAFFIDEEDHDQLMDALGNRLAEAKPIFRDQKRLLPPLPTWGKGPEYIRYAFCANDFEILGACFRREVEAFLAQLTTLYDFKTRPVLPPSEEDHVAVGPKGKQVLGPIPADPFRTPFKDRPSPPHLSTSLKKESALISQAPPSAREDRKTDVVDQQLRRRARSPSEGRHTVAEEDRRAQMYHAAPLSSSPHDHASRYSSHLRRRASPVPDLQGSSSFKQLFKLTKTAEQDPDNHGRRRYDGSSYERNPPRRLRRNSQDERREAPRGSPHETRDTRHRRAAGGDPDPSDSSSDEGSDSTARRRQPLQCRRARSREPRKVSVPLVSTRRTFEAHFDFKLKMDVVPTWDGDTATLARWIIRVNSIAKKSATIRQQLGMVVPQRLTGDAEIWYFSLPEHVREACEQDWEYIRNQIGDYFMNRSWMEKTRKQALAIRYRDSACPRELPSQYFIRAPRVWNTILTPRIYRTTSELQQAIKLHEDDLLEMEHLLPERPV